MANFLNNNNNNTADERLYEAIVIYGCTDQARQLLEEGGANVMAKDYCGQTPLHYASRFGYDNKLVDLLLEKGALVNDQTNLGYTPLHYACSRGRHATASLLLERGADPTIKNMDGKTALDVLHPKCFSLSLLLFASKYGKKSLPKPLGEKTHVSQENEVLMTRDNKNFTTPRRATTNMLNDNKFKAQQIDMLTSQNKTLQERVQTLSAEGTKLSQKNEALKQETETWKTKAETLQTQNESLLEQTAQLQTSLANLGIIYRRQEEQRIIGEINNLATESKERIAEEIAEKCLVCCQNPRTKALVPCGHISLCNGCADIFTADNDQHGRQHVCPSCRDPIAQIINIFHP